MINRSWKMTNVSAARWACLCCAAILGTAAAQQPLALPERPAYVAMLRADQHRDMGAVADALAAYRQALELFEALAREQPNYKTDAIARRISYCRTQLAALEGRAAGDAAVTPAAQLAVLEKAFADLQAAQLAANRELTALRAEGETLRRKLAFLEEARLAQSERAEAAERSAERTAAERDAIRAEREDLAAGRDRLAAEVEALRKKSGEMADLERRLEESSAASAAALSALRAELEAQIQKAHADAEEAGASLRAARSQRERDLQEIEALRARADRAATAERSAAELAEALAQIRGAAQKELAAARSEAERLAAALRAAEQERDELRDSLEQHREAAARVAKLEQELDRARAQSEQEANQARSSTEAAAEEVRQLTAELDRWRREAVVQRGRAERAIEAERAMAGARSDAERELKAVKIEMERQLDVARQIARDREALLRTVERLERQVADLRRARAGEPAETIVPPPPALPPPVETPPANLPAPPSAPPAETPETIPPMPAETPEAVPSAPADPLAEAEARLTAGDWAGAWALADEVLRRQPRRADARFVQARAALGRGDLREARRIADRLARDDRRSALYEHFLGILSEREKDAPMAYHHFQRAVELERSNAAYHKDLAMAAYALGRTAEAIQAFEAAVKINPDDGRARFNLAALLSVSDERRIPEAREHYERAIELGEERDETVERRLHP